MGHETRAKADVIDTVLIAGATASGKSALAIAVARAVGGTIVNADSMQVYRELRILSARPSVAEEAMAPHAMFGIVSALAPYSVALWLEEARRTIAAVHAAGGVAIVTGGTGLYFKALSEGLSEAPKSDADIRALSRQRRAALGVTGFHEELVRLDPLSAALSPGDTQRVLRAWEVVTKSGRGLSDWKAEQAPPVAAERVAAFVVDVEREALYARIDRRFDAMMDEGAMEEARAFWALEPSPDVPAAKALGLPQLKRVLDGKAAVADAVMEAKMLSRRYAKRQGTWFRNQTPEWMRLDATASDADALAARVLAAMSRR